MNAEQRERMKELEKKKKPTDQELREFFNLLDLEDQAQLRDENVYEEEEEVDMGIYYISYNFPQILINYGYNNEASPINSTNHSLFFTNF